MHKLSFSKQQAQKVNLRKMIAAWEIKKMEEGERRREEKNKPGAKPGVKYNWGGGE